MHSTVYWIKTTDASRFAIMARPRAGDWLENEVAGWKSEGIDVVVSLLERSEISELELEREASLCDSSGIAFIHFPIADRAVPGSLKSVDALIHELAQHLKCGRAVAIHCRAGIGRSALLAACVLVFSGMNADKALETISLARGVQVPDTDEQRAWVMRYRA